MNMTTQNEAYLQSIGVQPGTSAWQNCLEAMAVWGDNRWWLSEDPRERAYYQTVEDLDPSGKYHGRLLMIFSQYHEDIEVLLNRPVYNFELSRRSLLQEAERAWKYGVGCMSDAERQERVGDAVKYLQRIAQEHGKETIIVETQD
jgi:hypothetical protein